MANPYMANQYDVIIVGGGMVGLAMAASLVDLGISIAVLEKSNFEDLSVSKLLSESQPDASDFGIRVSAISPGNQKLLTDWQAWNKIPSRRLANYEFMRVWDAQGSGEICFNAADVAQPWLGSIVENQVLRAAIYQALSAHSQVQLLSNMTVNSIMTEPDRVQIESACGRTLSARLLIGADGALSSVRQKLMIGSEQTAYAQRAFVANVRTELAHQDTAWQRFTPFGPVAFLPLPDPHLCSIVWSIDEAQAASLDDLNQREFAEKLGKAFELRLGQVELVSDFAAFPLIKRHSETYLSQRCALVGDAAHTIHPLAGQGVNLGFQDVACLSRVIAQQHQQGRDIGLTANLRPFERERKSENYLMQNAMSGFKWGFGQQSLPLTLLRNFALNFVDNQVDLKNIIIKRAMGI